MAGWQGGSEAVRQGGRVAGWQGGSEAGWQGGSEAGWQGGREAGWLPPPLPLSLSNSEFSNSEFFWIFSKYIVEGFPPSGGF